MYFDSDKLAFPRRYLRTQSDKLSFGPAGPRLFVDYLNKRPGFSGRIDFIHKMNITQLFAVVPDWHADFTLAKPVWYPDRLTLDYEDSRCQLHEVRYITGEDIAVSWQIWQNKSDAPLHLQLVCEPEKCTVTENTGGGYAVVTPETEHGYHAVFCVGATGFAKKHTQELPPHTKTELVIAAAVGNGKKQTGEQLEVLLEQYLSGMPDAKQTANDSQGARLLAAHRAEYRRFFKGAPTFCCSDPWLEACWNYRWYLLKNTLARPDFGNFRHAVMYEGRSHKMGKEPFSLVGWEFTKLIPLTTPMHLLELQWVGDPSLLRELVQSLVDSRDEDGIFRVMTTEGFGNSYANFAVWAVWQCVQTQGIAWAADLIAPLKSFVDGSTCRFGAQSDSLQVETVHQLTGKEYQPSYWYFHHYPEDCYDKATFTPLKRVDRSVYHYRNLVAMAGLCALVGDDDADRYRRQAQQVSQDILVKMWDENTRFYYDLHVRTDERAMVKNITGIYPFWAEIVPEEHLPALETLFDASEFATPYPFPSVSKKCPAYSATGGWMGHYIKGRDGCVWCGPTWPYTNSVALEAIAVQSLQHAHRYDRVFGEHLRSFVRLHFRGGDIGQPYLVEQYNPETGEPLSDEVDYNHSYFIHLLMRYVVGVHAEREQVVVEPLDIGLDSFACKNIRIGENCLDVRMEDGWLSVAWNGVEVPVKNGRAIIGIDQPKRQR